MFEIVAPFPVRSIPALILPVISSNALVIDVINVIIASEFVTWINIAIITTIDFGRDHIHNFR